MGRTVPSNPQIKNKTHAHARCSWLLVAPFTWPMAEFNHFGLLNWVKIKTEPEARAQVVPGYTGEITQMPLTESFAEWELIIKHFCATFLATVLFSCRFTSCLLLPVEVASLINKHCWLLPKGALLTRLGETWLSHKVTRAASNCRLALPSLQLCAPLVKWELRPGVWVESGEGQSLPSFPSPLGSANILQFSVQQ